MATTVRLHSSVVLLVPYGLPGASIPQSVHQATGGLSSTCTVEIAPAVPEGGSFENVLNRIATSSVDAKVISVVVVPNDGALAPTSTDGRPDLKSASAIAELLIRMNKACPSVFTVVFSHVASSSPLLRQSFCSGAACHMVTHVPDHLRTALSRLIPKERVAAGRNEEIKEKATFSCPVCRKDNMTAEELWFHVPQFHVNNKKSLSLAEFPCPICGANNRSDGPLAPHIHERHAPPGHHVTPGRSMLPAVAFGLCVIQRKSDKKFLVVQEYDNQGYWLPGGGIDANEMPDVAAARECLEEAGVEVELTGLLRVEVSPTPRYVRLRYIFFGHPVRDDAPCKTYPDFESVGACWVSLEDLKDRNLQWRGREPHDWFTYVAMGGMIPPITMLTREGDPPILPR